MAIDRENTYAFTNDCGKPYVFYDENENEVLRIENGIITVSDGANFSGNVTIDLGGLVNTVLNLNGSTDYQIRSTSTDLFEVRDNTSGVVRLEINSSGKVTVKNDLQVDSNLGFYGTTPISQPTALTTSATDTVDATYGSEESTVINNVRTRLDELESKLQALGIIA